MPSLIPAAAPRLWREDEARGRKGAMALHGSVETAIIETARVVDSGAILSFLRGAGDEKLLPRPDEDFHRAIEAGLFFAARREGELIAVAGAFALNDTAPFLVEMGSCYVAPAFRGFGLQKLLVRARIGAIVALVDPDARLLAAVAPQNRGSLASVLKAGFEPLTEDSRLLLELCAYCATPPGKAADRLCCCDFFHIPRDRQRREVAALLRPGSVAVARADGSLLTVTMALDVLKPPHRAALEAFAHEPERSGQKPATTGA